jgi:hypothetical protein
MRQSKTKQGKTPKWRNGHPKGKKGVASWNSGKTYDVLGRTEIKHKIASALKGHVKPDSVCKKISAAVKGKNGGYRRGGGRGKHGWYKGFWCDSSWELAFVIYHLHHQIPFERNTKKFPYLVDGEIKMWIPDYKTADGFVEVKGYMTDLVVAKMKSFPHPLRLLGKDEMIPILEFVIGEYGRDFIRLYE